MKGMSFKSPMLMIEKCLVLNIGDTFSISIRNVYTTFWGDTCVWLVPEEIMIVRSSHEMGLLLPIEQTGLVIEPSCVCM